VNEEVVWQKLLKEDIVQKVIYRDLVEYYGVKKPSTLENLFLYLAEHSSEILNASSISNSLNLSRPYVEKYLNYLKQAFLIHTLMKYSRSVAKRVRSNEKAQLIDCGLISCFGSGNEDRKLESVVGRHLWGRALFYWRERLEVDFVIDGQPPLPVEVKNKTVLDAADFKGLLSFMNKFKVNTGLLISREELKEVKIGERKIYCLPAWIFCLIE
jgi:predicted AAA+ superfamily ATPase